jgi:hypothetical protein
MALIKFGSIITDSRGSIGGSTLKWSTAGSLMTRKGSPRRDATPRQSLTRSRLEMLSRSWWDVLTVSQRDDWRALAAANPLPNRWGDLFPLTGLAFFIRTNQRLLAAQAGVMFDAPADQTVTNLLTASLSVTAPSTASLTFTPSPVPANHVLVLKATEQLSPGRTTAAGRYRYLSAYPTSSASPLDVSSELSSLTGTLHTGLQIFALASFLSVDTGAESTPIAVATIVA